MQDYQELEDMVNEAIRLLREGYSQDSIPKFEKALSVMPKKEDENRGAVLILNNYLGVAYAGVEDYQRSIECFEICLASEQNNSEYLKNCALSYEKIGKQEKALELFERALSLNFDKSLLSKVIFIKRKKEQFTEADSLIQKGLEKFPEEGDFVFKAVLNNRDLKKGKDSLPFLDKDLSQFENVREIKFALSADLFYLGHYEKAWEFYEERICMELLQKQYKKTEQFQRWDFSDLNGKTILLTVEQGFGDSIHFFRYALALKGKFPKARIIFASYPQLLEVFKESSSQFEYINFLDQQAINDLQGIDFTFPIMSLGLYFNTSPDNSLYTQKYLKVKNSAKLKSDKFKVGICWRGRETHPNDKERSIPLELWADILRLKNIDFFSLQYEATKEELEETGWAKKIDISKPINDFYDSAVLINALDCVLTIDSAVAHLSASMGKETLLLLPFIADWRWGKGEQSYWYESVKFFRQEAFHDWSKIFNNVNEVLAGR